MNRWYILLNKAENPSVIKGILDALYEVESISDDDYDKIVYYAIDTLKHNFDIDVEVLSEEQDIDSYAYMLQGLFI